MDRPATLALLLAVALAALVYRLAFQTARRLAIT